MLATTTVCIAMLISVPAPDKRTDADSTSWVGKSVVVIGTGVQIGDLNERNEIAPPLTPLLGLDYRVYGERGNFVQLKTRESVLGWTAKSNVLLVDDAVAYFSKRLMENPNDIVALNHRGWAWKLKGEHAAGIKDMTDALKINPETAFYNNRARILVADEQYERAITDYTAAIEMSQQFYLPYYNRGNCWHLMKEYDKALADFDRSLQINPKFALAHRNRGLAWQAKRDYDKAIADYSQALQIDPKLAPALADRGNALLAKGDLAKARNDLDAAIRTDATHEQSFCYRGRLWNQEKEYDKALADFAEAVRLNPRYAMAFQERATTWNRLKNYAKARDDFERSARFDAKNADALAALAFFLATCPDAKLRDGKQAAVIGQQAVELAKTNANANALEALAAAMAETKDFDKAIRTQQQALKGSQLQSAEDARRRLELYRKMQAYRQE